MKNTQKYFLVTQNKIFLFCFSNFNAMEVAMLILSRRKGERIKIGKIITLTVLDVTNFQVRLGFEAPLEIPINREEVVLKITRPTLCNKEVEYE
jgi:carbon storage regulator